MMGYRLLTHLHVVYDLISCLCIHGSRSKGMEIDRADELSIFLLRRSKHSLVLGMTFLW